MNSLTLQPGQNLGTVQSNNIVPVGNINAQNAQGILNNNSQFGGKIRKSGKHGKRGGSWGAVLNQAATPIILLGAQQSFGKSRSRSHSRKHRR
jgi:hypothetical protein